MERFIERFRYKATKARQAQSRVKKIDRIERIERDPSRQPLARVQVRRRRAGRAGRAPPRGRPAGGARTNAAGGRRALARAGRARLARGTERSRQDDADRGADRSARAGRRAGALGAQRKARIPVTARGGAGLIAARCWRGRSGPRGLTPNKARALLGRFMFSGEEVEKPMEGLSGGERRRLSLAILVASGANVLILDEPTNHLDIDAREALEDAISGFDGNVLLVSHDRALLDAVGTRRSHSRTGGCTAIRVAAPSTGASRGAPDAERARPGRRSGRPQGEGGGEVVGQRARKARRAVEERGQAQSATGARGREGGGGAARDRGRAGRCPAWASPSSSERATARDAAAERAVEEAYARWEAAST